MALSYSLRLTCLVAVSVGLLQTVCELLLWTCAPILLRVLRSLPLRQQERALYSIQVVPFLFAVSLTAFCWVPQYLSNETNFAPEGVGWICLVLVAAVTLRWGATVWSGMRMVLRTMHFSRAVRRDGGVVDSRALPVIAFAGTMPRIALVGLLRPFILISRSLTESGGLDPLALDLVLEHERSHAAQLDNWKLLSLHCLPRFRLRVSGAKSWMQLWQSTAERAADEDAVQGSTTRALRLAETLVAMARSRSGQQPELACTQFICDGTDLASRVDGLTQSRLDQPVRPMPVLAIGFGLAVLTAGAVLVSLTPALADLPEHLLHLG